MHFFTKKLAIGKAQLAKRSWQSAVGKVWASRIRYW